jgi:hypothetical protein
MSHAFEVVSGTTIKIVGGFGSVVLSGIEVLFNSERMTMGGAQPGSMRRLPNKAWQNNPNLNSIKSALNTS